MQGLGYMGRVGYQRVSTDEQVTDGQYDRLTAAGCEKIFTDHGVSGRKASRPEFDRMLEYLREGDQLVCVRLDRLGRSVKNLIALAENLRERKIDLVVLDQGIDTSTPAGRFFFHVLCALAEMEADINHERTMDGLKAARARGRIGGRKNKLSERQHAQLLKMYNARELTVAEIGEVFGISREAVYGYVKRASAA